MAGNKSINTVFKNAQDIATLDIFEEIDSFWGGIGAAQIAAELRASTASVLQVRIDSPGGSVTDGISIANLLKQAPQRVEVNIVGVAASIASVIALAGDTVKMSEGSFFMIHNVRVGLYGTASELTDAARTAVAMEEEVISIYTANAGKRGKLVNGSEEETREMFKQLVNGENWINAATALELGLADYIEGQERELTGQAATDMENFTAKYFNHAPSGLINRFSNMTKESKKSLFARFWDFVKGDPEAKAEMLSELQESEAEAETQPQSEEPQPQEVSELDALKAEIASLKEAITAVSTPKETEEVSAEEVEESEEDKIERLAQARAQQILNERKAAAPATAGTEPKTDAAKKGVKYTKKETEAFNALAERLKQVSGF